LKNRFLAGAALSCHLYSYRAARQSHRSFKKLAQNGGSIKRAARRTGELAAHIRAHCAFDQPMRGSVMAGSMAREPLHERSPQDIVDQLEATLKPLSPQVFDVETPEQISRAFAEIEKVVLASGEKSSH
jgi:hypothetical protein